MISRLKIHTRVLLLGGLPFSFLLFVLLTSVWVANIKDRYFHQLYDEHLAVLADVMATQHLLQQQALNPVRQYRTGWTSAESTEQQLADYLQQATFHWQAFTSQRPYSDLIDYEALDQSFIETIEKYQEWISYAGTDALEVSILNESTVNGEIDRYMNHFGGLVDEFVGQQIKTAALVRDRAERLTTYVCWAYLIGGSALLALIAVFIWRTQKSIRQPLEQLHELLNTVATTADLRLRAKAEGNDEIAEAERAVNTMLARMQQLVQDLSAGSKVLDSQALQVRESSAHILESSNNQVERANLLAAAMEQMSMSASQVVTYAEQGRENTSDAEALSNAGQDVVQKSVHIIHQLAGQVSQGAEAVIKLHQDSNQISAVLDVIRKISEQTNLLALNAAIEAARAGDAGRGFSVVADEVRALSGNTREATESIREMIEQLQHQASAAEATMSKANEQAKQSVELAESSGEHFADIRNAITAVVESTLHIVDASNEQQTVATNTAENIHRLNHDITSLTTAASDAADASHELKQQTDQLAIGWQQFQA